jgi:glycosyltransferase involved in cell wall biosynthesis
MRCDVSIIVPTYNEETDIASCLESLRAQRTRVSYEIIVSDSKSQDATREIASSYADKIVVISERGIAMGRNAGVDVARGDHLLFVDADTILPKSYVEDAHGKFDDASLAAFSGKFKFSPKSKRGIIAERFMDTYYRIYSRAGKALMLGFNTNVRKHVFKYVGGYREQPLEDVEFGMRVRRMGKTMYFPDIFVYTSSRRLKKMGLVGTGIYYLKLDLKLRYPELVDFTHIDNYNPIRLSTFKVQGYEEITFDTRLNRRIGTRLQEFNEIMQEFHITRLQMRSKIKSTMKSLSYLSSIRRSPEEYVDKAVELLKERYKRLRSS